MEENKNNFGSESIRGEIEKSMKELCDGNVLYLDRGLSYTAFVKNHQMYT